MVRYGGYEWVRLPYGPCRGDRRERRPIKYIARRSLVLLVGILVGALLGGLMAAFFTGGGWGEAVILGGCGGALLSMLYDPRADTYTVPTRGGAKYPGDWDD